MGVDHNVLMLYGYRITDRDIIDKISTLHENFDKYIYPDYYCGDFVYVGIPIIYVREFDEYDEFDVSKLENLKEKLSKELDSIYKEIPELLEISSKLYIANYYT